MTDFNSELRTRLLRLESVVPAPHQAIGAVLADAGATRMVPGKRRYRARSVGLLAAAALLIGASAVAAQRILYPGVPQPAIEAMLAEVMAAQECLPPAQAQVVIRSRLDDLGFADWAIEARGGGIDEARCIYAYYDAQLHAVLLLPWPGRDGLAALDGVRETLLERCLGRTDAIDLMSTTLKSLGMTNFDVRVRQVPTGQLGVNRKHVAAGCFVLASGNGWEGGRLVYWLFGP
jgi:hypothetical protein